MSNVFVGRQPIYSRNLETSAYELLFRSGNQNRADFNDGNSATAELLINTFTEIGLDRIVGSLPAFINVPEAFILNDHSYALPRERVVIEVLETVRPTSDVLSKLARLKSDGYTIAIDDFVYSHELQPFLELADIVKVDLPAVPADALSAHVSLLRNHKLKILAEKVETAQQFEHCRQLGFDYFQGYFFCRPTIVEGRQLPRNRLTMMRLLTKLQNPSVSLEEIAAIVRTEPALSFKLLRYVNSAYCGLDHKIESVQHAVTIAGMERIRAISCLTVLAQAAEDKPLELVHTLLIRARMAELLAERVDPEKTEAHFLAGLFSAVDALLDLPVEEALEMLPISPDIKNALIDRSGNIGMVLDCVLEYERGNWDQVSCDNLDDDAIRELYLQAIDWTHESMAGV